MTDQAWARGMAEFQRVGMPGWPYDDDDVSADRGQAYRKHLDRLSDEQWLHAVDQAVAQCKWFPTVHELLEFGDAYVRQYPALPRARSAAEREHDREETRRGLELIRKAAEDAGLELPKDGSNVVVLTDQRRRELRDLADKALQATEISGRD